MNEYESKIHGRVRKSSPEKENREIDQQTLQHIRTYDKLSQAGIARRLKELDREWDIEKTKAMPIFLSPCKWNKRKKIN